MRRVVELVLRPLVSAVLASLLTAVLLGGPPEVHTVREVKVLLPGKTVTRLVTVKECDTATVERLLNRVLRSRVESGSASFDNLSRERASNGADKSSSQNAVAKSGAAVAGVVSSNACGSVNVQIANTVSDSQVRSGDAEVDNDVDMGTWPKWPDVGADQGKRHRPRGTPEPTPTPTPSPLPSPTP